MNNDRFKKLISKAPSKWKEKAINRTNMKQSKVTLPSGEYLIIRVPKDAVNFGVHYILERFTYWYGPAKICHEDELPPGSWQLLGADPTALTESEAGGILEKVEGRDKVKPYVDYEFPESSMWTALESLDSLAASLGTEKPYVILKLKNIEK